MTRKGLFSAVLAFVACAELGGYTRLTTSAGTPERRTDTGAIQFLVNDQIQAGMMNSQGQTWITADSNPMEALREAVDAWAAVEHADLTFAPVQTTSLVDNGFDGQHVIVFVDTPEARAAIGTASAVTRGFFNPQTGIISDTDILFNPDIMVQGEPAPFSTTATETTRDIQEIATHELGHALGAGHTLVAGATMFPTASIGETIGRSLEADDLAFPAEVYPTAQVDSLFGTISGTATLTTGGPLRGAFVVAVDPSSGIVVSQATSLDDGSYLISGVPPGVYQVYVEPLNGPVRTFDVRLGPGEFTLPFQTTFLGGNLTPATVQVGAGATVNVDIAAAPGESAVEISFLGQTSNGGFAFGAGAAVLDPGQQTELLLVGDGLGVSGLDVEILGNAVVRSGPLGTIPISDGSTGIIVPVQVVAGATLREEGTAHGLPSDLMGTIVVTTPGGAASTFTGSLIVPAPAEPGPPRPAFTQAGVVSAASFLPGGVAPGEIVSIFGSDMGPLTGVSNGGFDPDTGGLGTTLGGVTVTFDGQPAPLFFVRNDQINCQVPFEVAGKANTSAVVSFVGASSSTVSVPVTPVHPGLFGGSGQAIILHLDDTANSPSNPESRGEIVIIWATGQGVVSPPVATGQPGPVPPSLASNVRVNFGGVTATPDFAGIAPFLVGLLQVNVRIPANAPTGGAVPVSISVQGVSSQPGTTVAIAP